MLGVLFMIPLRRMLTVREHGKLPYPAGTACARVLMAGEEGGRKARLVFGGLALGGVFKFLEDGLSFFPSEISTRVPGFRQGMIGMDTLPSLLSVGFVVGPRIGTLMAAGGVFAARVDSNDCLLRATRRSVTSHKSYQRYGCLIRYIGAGAVAAGGIISLARTLPTLWGTLRGAVAGLRIGEDNGNFGQLRTERDIPRVFSIVLAVVALLVIAFAPQLSVGVIGAIGVVIIGFPFVTVSSRIVGIIGSSSRFRA